MKERARSVFRSAEMYSRAAVLLNTSGNPTILLPSIVNAALSLELYFKSLYLLEHGADFKPRGRHSHDFHALYIELSASTRERLSQHAPKSSGFGAWTMFTLWRERAFPRLAGPLPRSGRGPGPTQLRCRCVSPRRSNRSSLCAVGHEL